MDGKSNGIGYSEKDNGVFTVDLNPVWEEEVFSIQNCCPCPNLAGRDTPDNHYSSINGQLKIMNEQASESQKHGVEELDNLKTKVTDLSDSMEEERTWDEAQDECYKVNSFLVMIKDRNESDSLNALINIDRYYWIGLRRDKIDIHIWKWTDGSEATFTNWGVNQPNFLMGVQHCGEINSKERSWNDMTCEYIQNYICEKNNFC
ncbi:unnamed protein product [Ranitomeya imitator]|uniref:C-type lectin domain-containing protein n=1 Tax=Ranitomeya imitator TaxID=111125 RepID=A0ABN9KSK5_9NEOB|nr:unnamed protein product [Ranitomeya imitator]